MEEDEIQAQACKFPRVGNGRNDSNKIGPRGSTEQYPDDEEEGGELRRRRGGGGGSDGSTNRFPGWHHHSSRIIRVSRASGGKDRHSKVMTSKGLRDRRVRLSVTTAIQFYDLQDRLGYDQPSKAVEWLIDAASDAISELPSLNGTFPDTPKQPSDEKRPSLGTEQGFDSADAELDGETNHQQNQSQNLSLSKPACSSTSETSKGSGLSLSRSEIRANRFKKREKARERTAKDKEKESESRNIAYHQHHNVNPMSQTASFTELLTAGIGGAGTVNPTTTSPSGSVHNQNHHAGGDETNVFNKASRQQWSSIVAPMDYFTSGLLQGPSSSSSSSSSRIHHLGNSLAHHHHHHHHQPMSTVSPFNIVTGESHSPSSDQLQQHFSFIPDHLIPSAVVTSSQQPSPSGGDYNLNFTISSGLAGYNRGTLQSNSPSLLPQHHHHHHHHLQRFSVSPIDGSNNNVNVPFFIGAAPASSSPSASAAPTMENNHHHYQFSPVFDGRGLQLCYGDGSSRHSDQKGKGKN